MITATDVPTQLIRTIADGQCVAFLGAGVSMPDAPDWKHLLLRLAHHASCPDRVASLLASGFPNAYELAAQLIRAAAPSDEAFEGWVQDVLGHVTPGKTAERYALLRDIPFAHVLTTNMDSLLDGAATSAAARDTLLRGRSRWFDQARWEALKKMPKRWTEVLKLHGDANGDASNNPAVLAATDYRRRLYLDGTYANLLRAVMATRTMLFLGFSFSDAYLNELRSEVLALVGTDRGLAPIAYAVVGFPEGADKMIEDVRRLRLEHERLHILPYTVRDGDHAGFDQWIRAIHDVTSPVKQLERLLASSRDAPAVVWIDPKHRKNGRGLKLLTQACGRRPTTLDTASALDERAHAGASLIITRMGYKGPGRADAFDVLSTVAAWPERPPVIVFASGREAYANRVACLRRGAWEYCSRWDELFDAIVHLFGRLPAPG